MRSLSTVQIKADLKLAQDAYRAGNTKSALAKIEDLLNSNPNCGEVHFHKGLMLAATERPSEALLAFAQVLRCEPDNAEALAWATQTSLKLRRPKETEAYARRLTRIQPKNDRALFSLSVALSLNERWEEALEAIDRALAIKPSEPDYIVGKAQLLAKMRLQSLAIDWYRKAYKLRPVPQIAYELAELLIEESQIPEALQILERFAPELPAKDRPNLLIARAYTESQRFEEAKPYWISAENYANDRRRLVEMRARSEIWGGRLDVAEQILREGIEADPSAALFYVLLASIVKIVPQDLAMVETVRELLRRGGLHPSEAQDLNFALGKSYDDLGDYATAIEFFDAANRLRPEVFPNATGKFDASFWRDNIDFQIEYFTEERVRSLSSEGFDSEKPVFIMGMIRSGTTLCEQILSCHSGVTAGGENTYWVNHGGEALDPLRRRFDMTAAKRLGKNYLQLLNGLGSGTRYVTDKYPTNVMFGAPLHCVFPCAHFIHTKRHPVDNLLSIWMTPIKTGLQLIDTREDLITAYREYLRLARRLERVLPEDRFKSFRYEEITSNPEQTIGNMLAFLDLEPEPSCFAPEANSRMVRTPSVYQVRQPINTNSQARWKRYEPWLGVFAELLEEKEH